MLNVSLSDMQLGRFHAHATFHAHAQSDWLRGVAWRGSVNIGFYLIVTHALSAGTVLSEMNVSLWMVGGREIDPPS